MNYYNLHKTLINIDNIFCDSAIFDSIQQKSIDDMQYWVYYVNVLNNSTKN